MAGRHSERREKPSKVDLPRVGKGDAKNLGILLSTCLAGSANSIACSLTIAIKRIIRIVDTKRFFYILILGLIEQPKKSMMK